MKTLLFLILLLQTSGAAQAVGDVQLGEEKAQSCAFCHNLDGNSTNPAYPKLAGQFANYILQQALLFHSGARKDAAMEGVVNVINSTQDLTDIAAYYASQPAMGGESLESPEAQQGRGLYLGPLNCYQCHGNNGEGSDSTQTSSPRLAGQHKAYLIKSMMEFRSGTRKSTRGYMMNMILPMASEQDIELMAEYLSRINLTADVESADKTLPDKETSPSTH